MPPRAAEDADFFGAWRALRYALSYEEVRSMKRVWRHFRAASVMAGVGGLLLASCAHDDSSFYVVQIVIPPVPVQNQGCLYTATNGTVPGLFSGQFDVGLSST